MRLIRRIGVVLAMALATVGVTAGTAVAHPNAPWLGPGYVTSGEAITSNGRLENSAR